MTSSHPVVSERCSDAPTLRHPNGQNWLAGPPLTLDSQDSEEVAQTLQL
jgi:hypothetical protein